MSINFFRVSAIITTMLFCGISTAATYSGTLSQIKEVNKNFAKNGVVHPRTLQFFYWASAEKAYSAKEVSHLREYRSMLIKKFPSERFYPELIQILLEHHESTLINKDSKSKINAALSLRENLDDLKRRDEAGEVSTSPLFGLGYATVYTEIQMNK